MRRALMIIIRRIILLVVVWHYSSSSEVLGCLNTPSKEQSLNGLSSEGHLLYYHLETSRNSRPSDKRNRLRPPSDPWDMAVDVILKGEYATAIAQLEEIEARDPGNYHTASNLGTAFELAGENEKALNWIREGIKRNARAHRGTEWLHELILEAKVAADRGVISESTTRLVAVPEQLSKDALLTIRGVERKASDVFDALAYQLEERMVFVKPKDRWVAECLFSLAVMQAHFYSIDDGLRILSLSEKYGFPDEALLATTRKEWEWSSWLGEVKKWAAIVCGSVAGLAILILGIRKLRELLDA